MNKKSLELLEKVFSAEIEGRLPFQTNAKLAQDLCREGMLEQDEVLINGVNVSGYWLTELGRMTYCQSCSDVEIPEAALSPD